MVALQRNVGVNPERWDKSQRAGEVVGGAIQMHLAHCSAILHPGLTSAYVACAVYLKTGMRHSEKMASLLLIPMSQFHKLKFIYCHTVFQSETLKSVSTRIFSSK